MKTTILLVDDHPDILKLLEYTFRQQGYDTVSAEDGAAALAVLERVRPDLIVTDVRMPVMDGYELCRRVRGDERWRMLPFIFLSAHTSPEDRVAGLDLGADDYVGKPFDRRELLAKVRTLLNRVRIYRGQVGATLPGGPGREPSLPSSLQGHVEQRPVHALLVDDEDAARGLLELSLTMAQFRVTAVGDGRQALEAIEADRPDIIISDVIMPVMDGIELRKALLDSEPYKSIPFLFLTARDQPEDMMTGLSLGVDDYLTKPVIPGVLVQKARNLVERYRANEGRYRQELQQAVETVTAQLQSEMPRLPGLSFVHRCEPLGVRGGDYCDYIELGDGIVGFALGDVMGKKWGAWFFSVAYVAYLRSVIRSASASMTAPAAVIRRINDLLWQDLRMSEVFSTLIFGVVDAGNRTVTWANAGHLPPIRFEARSNTIAPAGHGGLILGVQPHQEYEDESRILAPGDALIFYTDGITEARNRSGRMFGEQRLKRTVRKIGQGSGEQVVSGIFDELDRFVAGVPYDDDRSVLIIRADA